MKLSTQLALLLGLTLLVGCASNEQLTSSERAALDTVQLEPTNEIDSAYRGIDATDEKSYGQQAVRYAPGVGSFIAGSIVDGFSDQMQTGESQAVEGQYYDAVNAELPDSLQMPVQDLLVETLQSTPFFADRISNESNNSFSSTLWNYALKRVAVIDEVNQYAAQVKVYAEFSGPGDTVYARFNLQGESKAYPLRTYAENPQLVQRSIDEALSQVQQQFANELNLLLASTNQ